MLQTATSVSEPGCRELIAALDGAVRYSVGPEARTRAVRDALTDLIHRHAVQLPAALMRPAPDSYARRLIYANPTLGYTALAMVWGPGQGTPLHDHAGLWCVEGVLQGRIEVTQYDLLERSGSQCRFERQGTEIAGVGSAGRLIPPFDYHTLANALVSESSVTIHVYGGDMDHCSVYLPVGEGWYEEVSRELKLSA